MGAISLGMAAVKRERLYGGPSTMDLKTDSAQQYFGKLVQLIPADIIAGYVAVTALIPTDPQSKNGLWAVAAAFLALTPIVVILTFLGQFRKANRSWPPRQEYPWFSAVAAFLAFLVWVFALPDSPFADLSFYQNWTRSLALIITTILLPLLAQVFGADITE